MPSNDHVIRILHYNDVYNIDVAAREPVGGAARFITAIQQNVKEHKGDTLTLFSGDAFSPAPLTSITKGAEIPPILNATNIDVACIGNHELDNGHDILNERLSETNFPWVCSNVRWKKSNLPLGNGPTFHVLERGGIRFGFIGLAALEWLSILDKLTLDDFYYEDFCKAADRLSSVLRQEHNCQFIIALTHMRQADDEVLAENAKDIDLILGGHEHVLSMKHINNRWTVKSGTDFKHFSTIDLSVSEGEISVQKPVHHFVTSKYNENPEWAAYVNKNLSLLGTSHLQVLAYTSQDLDGRFISIRTRETGLGNFICDVMTEFFGCKIGVVNSGSFRSDSIEEKGRITTQTINTILPFHDQAMVAKYSGAMLLEVLENSVSEYPALAGRFLQVSGIKFSFDPRKPPGQRIDPTSVFCKSDSGEMKPMQATETYYVVLKSFIFDGKEGFPAGDACDVIERSCSRISEMVSQFLAARCSEAANGAIPTVTPRVQDRIICLKANDELLSAYEDK